MFRKSVLIVSTIAITGCANGPFPFRLENAVDANIRSYRESQVVIISDPTTCERVTVISVDDSAHNEGTNSEQYLTIVAHLKRKAYKAAANAIAEFKTPGLNTSIGSATAYKCPIDVFDKYKPLQKSREFILSTVHVDPKQ